MKDRNGVEHFWLSEIERKDGVLHGTIANTPNVVKHVKAGQRVTFPDSDISDWTYFRGDKLVGNETLRPLLKHMPPQQAARYRSMMAP